MSPQTDPLAAVDDVPRPDPLAAVDPDALAGLDADALAVLERPVSVTGLAALEEGWDGNKAPPPGAGALAVVGGIAMVPTTVGGVQIEWHAAGWDIAIELDPDGRVLQVWAGQNEDVPLEPGGDVLPDPLVLPDPPVGLLEP